MLVKLYGDSPDAEKRYSPVVCIGCRKTRIEGTVQVLEALIVLARDVKAARARGEEA
jgi:hypothetical protein